MKKIFLVGFLCIPSLLLSGEILTVTGNGESNVTVTLDAGAVPITGNDFNANSSTQEGVISGDLVIDINNKLAIEIDDEAFAGIVSIGGSLSIINASGVFYLSNAFPDLVTISGSLDISDLSNSSFNQDFTLPALTSIGGNILIGNTPFLPIDTLLFDKVVGNVHYQSNDVLAGVVSSLSEGSIKTILENDVDKIMPASEFVQYLRFTQREIGMLESYNFVYSLEKRALLGS